MQRANRGVVLVSLVHPELVHATNRDAVHGDASAHALRGRQSRRALQAQRQLAQTSHAITGMARQPIPLRSENPVLILQLTSPTKVSSLLQSISNF